MIFSRCCQKGCNTRFHFPCNVKAGGIFQFSGNMYAFCRKHRIKQRTENFILPPDEDCIICYEQVEETDDFKKLSAPCCGRIYHKICVEKYAMSAGSEHFKCSNCNDVKKIMKEFQKLGVYIPHQDARWEQPDNSHFYNYDGKEMENHS